MRIRIRSLVALVAGAFAFASAPAHAAFPYRYEPGSPPDDLTDKRVWMYAATPDRSPDPLVQANNADRRELGGVRGASLVDADPSAAQAWTTTTGRPDVTIAVLDSGIEWNDDGAMRDLRAKVRLNRAELPAPNADRTAPAEPGADCGAYRQREGDDLDGNGVVNVLDWACDARVRPDPPRGVNDDVLEPQDLLIAFSDGADDDGNGFADDIAGWDFLDDDNDAYDDVQYGHGTGEARDSSGEADNGGDLGACPNCTFVPLRVGTSFIADVNRFALAVTYAVDNGVLVVQEALGTLNKSRLGGDAVEYAYRHGVAIIASAADEAAQHHNWPSSYPRVIVVNSVTRYDETFTPGSRSYLQLNGCTNFSSRITLAVPSVSCSSDATGRGAGMAGLVYSAALDAIERGEAEPHPACTRSGGGTCPISANEVRQLLIGGADDVNFARDPATGASTEVTCVPLPTPACTDPFLAAPTTRLQGAPLATRSYPARRGHDQFYGYGRVNMARTVGAVTRIPPEVELESPGWYDMVDPAAGTAPVRGEVWARGRPYRCRVLVAPGSYPSDAGPEAAPPGDFTEVPSPVCDGSERTAPLGGELARIDLDAQKARFPANTEGFDGREPGSGEQTASGRPNTEPTAFVVKVVATADGETGQDRRQAYLHRDRDLLPGFPRQLDGDGEASPALADLDGDNRSELIVANSDGVVHALRPDGSDAPGFPVRTDELPMQAGRAFGAGGVRRGHGAILASPAVGDLDRDGVPEIVAADLEGKVDVWGADGARIRTLRSNPDYSGRPLEPFANVSDGHLNRTQLGFLGSPVLADLDRDGTQEIVAAAMDRHVYAWDAAGNAVPGFPVLVVDRDKVASVEPRTHRVAFDRAKVPGNLDQGAIVSTPAVGDLTGDGRPEIVVGTNESYAVNQGSEGPLNAAGVQAASYQALGAALSVANGRLFALSADGDPDGEPMTRRPAASGPAGRGPSTTCSSSPARPWPTSTRPRRGRRSSPGRRATTSRASRARARTSAAPGRS